MFKININDLDTFKSVSEEIYEIETSKSFEYIELNNAYVLISNNRSTIYTNTFLKYENLGYINFSSKSNLNSKYSKDNIVEIKESILLSTSYPNIYYHWIYDILPQLSINIFLKNISYLTLPLKYSFQNDSLKYFLPNIKVHSKLGLYKVNKLLIPHPTTDITMPKQFVFNFLRKNEKFTDNVDSYIYITRKKGFKRRILNEKKLIKYLKSIGFKIYSLEDINFLEQKKYFETAKFILSAHGSGLANIIFCNTKCNVLEIYGPGCGERCFARIAHKLRIPYKAVAINNLAYVNILHKVFYKIVPNKNPFHFRVDIRSLRDFLITNYNGFLIS